MAGNAMLIAPAKRSNGMFPRSCRLTPSDRPAGVRCLDGIMAADHFAMIGLSWRHAVLPAAAEYNEFPGVIHAVMSCQAAVLSHAHRSSHVVAISNPTNT